MRRSLVRLAAVLLLTGAALAAVRAAGSTTPLIDAVKAGGRMTGDRHLAAPKGTQLANAMLDLAQKWGAEIDRFGVSTGRMEL